ncbi:MAG TPA: PrsW family intramembrane metalloprotease [Actinomycetales bacterium]|nr:PrsW family intramembrane metalloprotease [Actinomycetales bacterium]
MKPGASSWGTVPAAAGRVSTKVTARRPVRTVVLRALLVALAVLVFLACALLVLLLVGHDTGATGLAAGVVFALVPVLVVVPSLLWLDRFESEPPVLVVFAFAWGAVVSTFVALVVNSYSLELLRQAGGELSSAAVLVAPWVEETCKGSVVLLVLLWRRHEFDGVVDGVVYAGLAGAGFAFTENVLYLGRALHDSGTSGLAVTFVLRCVFGPFAHPLFTMATGIGLGVAVTTSRRWLRWTAPVAGWLCAVALHALWNLGAVAGLRGFVGAYVVVQMPIFVLAVVFALWARHREGRLIARQLAVYVSTGWLTPAELTMLASSSERRRALTWAGTAGGRSGRRSMRMFQATGTDLAFLRARVARGAGPTDAVDAERTLLRQLAVHRYGFVAQR